MNLYAFLWIAVPIVGLVSASFSCVAQPQVNRCMIDGQIVFQDNPCPRKRDPVSKPQENLDKRPDPEALRAEQTKRREEIQKNFLNAHTTSPGSALPQQANQTSAMPKSSSTSMAFEDCIRTIQRTAVQLGSAPVTIIETYGMQVIRFMTGDGSVLVTCSRPDHKMVTTVSPK